MVLIGAAALLCIVLALVGAAINPFGGRSSEQISISIDTPYIGQGIQSGTAVVLHGVEIGKVTNVAMSPSGSVRLATDLQSRPVAGLTESMQIDFRPVNYFGVPGVNIIPTPGGQQLRDGTQISLTPQGNFTLSELLSQLGNVSAASLTPQLITVIDRVTRYTDGFNPLFETMLIVSTAVADVQTVQTTQLLETSANISAALPSFANEMVNLAARTGDFSYYPEHGDPRGIFPRSGPEEQSFEHNPVGRTLTPPFVEYSVVRNLGEETPEYFEALYPKFLEPASGGLFAAVGKLLGTHSDDLLPLVTGLKSITDTAPALLRPGDVATTLAELRSRFEKLYGGNGEQRALQVRVLLDSLPGIAAPLAIVPEGAE
jgi:hypothetical protein